MPIGGLVEVPMGAGAAGKSPETITRSLTRQAARPRSRPPAELVPGGPAEVDSIGRVSW
jgi:hypothetical protein